MNMAASERPSLRNTARRYLGRAVPFTGVRCPSPPGLSTGCPSAVAAEDALDDDVVGMPALRFGHPGRDR